MAEEKKQEGKKEDTKKTEKHEEKKHQKGIIISREDTGRIIRILQTDVPGNKSVYAGLTRIKGVSWSISNAVCILNKIDKNKKVDTLSKEEIQGIEKTLKEHKFPLFLLNRRKDFSAGKDIHLLGSDLDLNEELDIKRLKKIRSFRGLRHAMGQPTRGQSTKSHFRANRKKGVGVKNKRSSENTKAGTGAET
jgi:small subunit ribosomal protein S13